MRRLNKEQLQAIRHKSGPLLIIAGAGTGKTTVITERVKYLIEKKLAKPEEILALTFTEKAAREMETRIDIALPYGYSDMWVLTFHSFCERVLRQNALHIGLDPKFKLTTEAETVQLIRQNLFNAHSGVAFKLNYFRPLGNPYKFIGGMMQHFSRLQDEDVSVVEYLKWSRKAKDEKWMELANAYRTYDELKTQNSLMDFGDLITKTLKLFRARANILKEYQARFKYILIDEFQDTNYAQNQLALLLAGKVGNINVVGDDDQSVYRFRGAAVSNIIQFRKNFPKTKVVVLTKNYRSTQEILDRSYDLIQHNNPDRLEVVEKIDKKLVAMKEDPPAVNLRRGKQVQFIHVDRVENEAEEAAKIIKELTTNPLSRKASEGLAHFDFKDIAILVRANNHAEPFVRALDRHGIPNQFLGPARLFKQPEIVDLISYLKVLYNFEDSISFYKVLAMDIFDVNPREVASLLNYARKNNISLFESAERSKDERVIVVTDLVKKHLGLIKKESAGQILYDFLEESGILSSLVKPDTVEAEKRANNISRFLVKLKSYEVSKPEANLFNVVDWLDLSSELGESPLAADTDWGESDSVNILTVHSAKGLEFPVVFLVNLVAQRFPTTERHEQIPISDGLIKEILPKGDYHIEEERRLFYVGMTRAKERLYLTAADYYGEGKREKKLSLFVGEAMGIMPNDKQQVSSMYQSDFSDYQKIEQKEGEKRKKLKIDYLSYSQIEAFKICPLHYKLRYILKIPLPPTASLSFGISMHNALKDFYLRADNNIVKLLQQNWIKEGYLSKAHENEFLYKGKKSLKEYLKKYPLEMKHKSLLEESFVIPISGNLRIGGQIDRIDMIDPPKGSHLGGQVEIWDYKTGEKVPTQKEVDNNLQLTIYALAAAELYGKTHKDIKLSLYYFETQTKITTTRTVSDLEKAKKEILKIRDEIQNSEFKCSGGFLCQNCEYRLFCKTDD